MKSIAISLLLIIGGLIVCALSGCAQTKLYDPTTGKLLASMQGDMHGAKYRSKDVEWSADTVDHSTATTAQGNAGAGKIHAIGAAIAAAGLTTLIK